MFLVSLLSVAIGTPVSYFCFRICFQRGNLTPISVEMLSIRLIPAALVTGNTSALSWNACLTRTFKDSWQPTTVETEKPYGYIFVDNRPNTPGNRQGLSEVFGCCRVYPTINKSLKPEEKVEANPPKDLKITASCATQFSRGTHKYFDLVWYPASWPAVQNYIQQAPQ